MKRKKKRPEIYANKKKEGTYFPAIQKKGETGKIKEENKKEVIIDSEKAKTIKKKSPKDMVTQKKESKTEEESVKK